LTFWNALPKPSG